MAPRYTNGTRQVIEKYENGVWGGFDENEKLVFIHSIDNILFGQPGIAYVFDGYFTSSEEKQILSDFISSLSQYSDKLRETLQSDENEQPVTATKEESKLIDTLPKIPLAKDEKELNAILNSITLSPEMGDQFMVVCSYFKNLLAGGRLEPTQCG